MSGLLEGSLLSELGVRRYADRHNDGFVCLGSELDFAFGGLGIANVVRRIGSLPAELASVRKHPERRGVYQVSLPGFAEIQGLQKAKRLPLGR